MYLFNTYVSIIYTFMPQFSLQLAKPLPLGKVFHCAGKHTKH